MRPSDETEVADMSLRSFQYDRFHRDALVPDATANLMKAAWVGNFFCGRRGDAMIVYENPDGSLGGFLQILRPEKSLHVIDLIAVDENCRGNYLS